MSDLIEGMADCIAQGTEGLPYADLAEDRAQQREWHRAGCVTNINLLTKSEARAIAKHCMDFVLNHLAENITDEMVDAACLATQGGADLLRHEVEDTIKAALSAATRE